MRTPAPLPVAIDSGPDCTPDSRQTASRIGWLDSARGLGIILVVIGHALGGLIDSPLGADQDVFRRLFFSIYTFHMPLFFAVNRLALFPVVGFAIHRYLRSRNCGQ